MTHRLLGPSGEGATQTIPTAPKEMHYLIKSYELAETLGEVGRSVFARC